MMGIAAGKRLPGMVPPMHWWKGFGDIRLAGDSWGDPGGPLVILQHGGGQTRHAWKGTGEVLGDHGYHVVAFDARGHGDSDWAPDGHYGPDVMIDDLDRIITAVGKRRPVLVGASMGGSTSLIGVGEGRVEAAALVLVDIAPRSEPDGVMKINTFMNKYREGFDSLEEVADAISGYQPHRNRPKDLSGLAKNVRIHEDGKYRWHWDPRFRQAIGDREQYSLRQEVSARRLTVPTLLVRGGLSDIVSENVVRDFLEMCPHAEHVSITDAGHMIVGDRNDVFGRAVIDFLLRVAPVHGRENA